MTIFHATDGTYYLQPVGLLEELPPEAFSGVRPSLVALPSVVVVSTVNEVDDERVLFDATLFPDGPPQDSTMADAREAWPHVLECDVEASESLWICDSEMVPVQGLIPEPGRYHLMLLARTRDTPQGPREEHVLWCWPT